MLRFPLNAWVPCRREFQFVCLTVVAFAAREIQKSVSAEFPLKQNIGRFDVAMDYAWSEGIRGRSSSHR